MADLPPLVMIVMFTSLGDRISSAEIWPGAGVRFGWMVGLVIAVLLSDPLRDFLLRWYGLSPEARR